MADTVADFVVERLTEWGVSRVYGYPGDGINGITTALRRASKRDGGSIDFIQVRHEETAAEVLNSGEQVAMLVGQGALHASEEVEEVAELLGAGVANALLGKGVLSDNLSYVTGAIGLLGTKPSWDMMQNCDPLLMVGTNMPYSDFLPQEGQARGVQIDIDVRMPGFRYPTEVNLVGDSKKTLRSLVPLLRRKADRSWREWIERRIAHWWRVVEARAMNPAHPVNPQRVFWELSEKLPDRVMIACDCDTATAVRL